VMNNGSFAREKLCDSRNLLPSGRMWMRECKPRSGPLGGTAGENASYFDGDPKSSAPGGLRIRTNLYATRMPGCPLAIWRWQVRRYWNTIPVFRQRHSLTNTPACARCFSRPPAAGA